MSSAKFSVLDRDSEDFWTAVFSDLVRRPAPIGLACNGIRAACDFVGLWSSLGANTIILTTSIGFPAAKEAPKAGRLCGLTQ